MKPALRALNRFGLGARIGEAEHLSDPRGWLVAQLRPEHALLSGDGLPTHADVEDAVRRLREVRRSRDQDAVREARRSLRTILETEERAVLGRRVSTDTPFLERLVAFWSNHLCVSVAAKAQVVPFAGLYEREAIRPHVLGSFADMVLASAHHPAMLLYLDNAESIGPDSPAARILSRRTGAPRGINENYARELMELHTLGVDGGYTQADVIQMARILTGWSVAGNGPRERGRAGSFVFRPAAHEPGSKTLLGKRYQEGGEAEGERAIRDLCAHPATVRFVSTKLVRHFVSDDPPAPAVDRIAGVFRASEGDLSEVSRALVSLDEAWDPDARKLRTPQDWIVAMLRTLRAPEVPTAFVNVLRALRHPLWAPSAPKGYGDRVSDWADPDSLMQRAELSRSLSRRLPAIRMRPERILDVVDVEDGNPLPGMLSDGGVAADERLALGFGGPAFQWR